MSSLIEAAYHGAAGTMGGCVQMKSFVTNTRQQYKYTKYKDTFDHK